MKFGKGKVKMSREELELLLDQAYDKAPYSDFVASCEEFLEEKGFLTEKQIEALINVKPSKEATGRYSKFDTEQEEELFDSYEDLEDCND